VAAARRLLGYVAVTNAHPLDGKYPTDEQITVVHDSGDAAERIPTTTVVGASGSL
jgi:hypothetical protein